MEQNLLVLHKEQIHLIIEGVIGGSGNDKLTGNTKQIHLLEIVEMIFWMEQELMMPHLEYDYLDGGDGKILLASKILQVQLL